MPHPFRTDQRVTYRPHPGADPEHGTITEPYALPHAARVRYDDEVIAKLTPHDCLTPTASAEEVVLRAAQQALSATLELSALLESLAEADPSGRGPYLAAVSHRAHLAAVTLRLDEMIRQTLPLLTWAEGGTAVTVGVPASATLAMDARRAGC